MYSDDLNAIASDLRNMTKGIEQAKEKRANLEGSLKTLTETLKKTHQLESVELAQDKIVDMSDTLESLSEQLNGVVIDLHADYKKLEGFLL